MAPPSKSHTIIGCANRTQHGSKLLHQGMISFMDLSRELRDIIYHELWQQTRRIHIPRKCGRYDCRFEVHYNTEVAIHPRMHSLPRWLLANKTLLEEGLLQLYSNAEWELCWDSCTKIVGDEGYSHLIALCKATNLTLGITSPVDRVHFRETDPEYGRLNHCWALNIDHIIPEITPRLGPTLQSLTIDTWFYIEDSWNITNTHWAFHIKGLDSCSLQLRSFSLRVSASGDSNLDMSTCAPDFETVCRDETIRVGSLLVGKRSHNESDGIVIDSSWVLLKPADIKVSSRYFRKR